MSVLTELDTRTEDETEVIPPIPCTSGTIEENCNKEARWDALTTCDLHPTPRTRHWCDEHKEWFMDESQRVLCSCQGYPDWHDWNLLLLLAR